MLLFGSKFFERVAYATEGGASGSSSSCRMFKGSIYVCGNLDQGFEDALAKAGMRVIKYSGGALPEGCAVLLDSGAVKSINAITEPLLDNFNAHGFVGVFHPTQEAIAQLYKALKIESPVQEISDAVGLYAVQREASGDTRVFLYYHSDESFVESAADDSDDIYSAVRSGDVVEVYKNDDVVATVEPCAVSIDKSANTLAVSVDGKLIALEGYVDGNTCYAMVDGVLQSSAIESEAEASDGLAENSEYAIIADVLCKWIAEADAASKDTQATVTAVKMLGADTSVNLADLAKTYKETMDGKLLSKSFIINNYILSYHEFSDTDSATGGRDYYFVVQSCSLDASNDYVAKWAGTRYTTKINGKRYYVGQGEVKDNYAKRYVLKNAMKDVPDGFALEVQPSPVAKNHATTTTSEIGWSTGFELAGGFQGKDASGQGTFSFGASYSTSKTFETDDVEVELSQSGGSVDGSVLTWTYEFASASRNSSKWQRINEGARLGHSTFTPTNMWVWSMPTSGRPSGGASPSFDLIFTPTMESKLTRNSGSIPPRTLTKSGSATMNIPLPMPPLLAVEESNLVFDNSSTTQTVNIGSQGVWTAKIKSGDSWVDIYEDTNQSKLGVTMKSQNTSGKPRSGEITVSNVCGETCTIYVTQYATPLSE